MQTGLDEAAEASPSGRIAKVVRKVFSTKDLGEAAANLRKEIADRMAACLKGTEEDPTIVKEYQRMLDRYQTVKASTAVVPFGGEVEVGFLFCSLLDEIC